MFPSIHFVSSYPFHSLLLILPNKGIDFPFPPLKLSNKRRKEYYKIFLFIHFYSISFPLPKRRLRTSINMTLFLILISISACGVWGVRVKVQVSKREFHIHIPLDYARVEFLSCIKYEMGSSYTWCNSTKVTHFLNRRFLRNLMVRKSL